MRTEELKRRKLQERGITLVALVVTIIILLILAGVTLNLALGEGGILARAKNTVNRYQVAQANELDQMTKLEEMLNSYRQGGSTGETDDPTSPSGGTDSSEVAGDLKKYQGKYVDIGLDVNENTETTDDWELFYATEDRIFLIAADYVPVTKLTSWGILGDSGTLGSKGFKRCSSSLKNSVFWPSGATEFSNEEGLTEDFLKLVMHTGYDLTSHKDYSNAKPVSQLLNKEAWSVVKTAASAEKQQYIDFVIGGSTLEMWCAAWKGVVGEGNETFKPIEADPKTDGYGYNVKYNGISDTLMYVTGSKSSKPDASKLAEYNTFFPHTSAYESCNGYWLASPSADYSYTLMCARYGGYVNGTAFSNVDVGVRPVVSIKSGVHIVERENAENIYDVTK